jgi:signal transduction histidine kinase
MLTMPVSQALRAAWRCWWSPRFRDSESVPLWATTVVTLLWNTAFGLAITAFVWVFSGGRIGFVAALGWNVLTAQCIGFAIFGLFLLAGRLIGGDVIDSWRGSRRALFFALLPLAGVFIGYAVAFWLIGQIKGGGFGGRWFSGWWVAGALMVWALLSFVFWRFYVKELRVAEAEQQMAADRARAAELRQQTLDAQLRTLQAQIEPHFLFNTLANVVSLVDAQPADAKRMLERLIDLLRGSLSASRAQHATLGQEVDLLRAYLDILAIRMAHRLRYEIAVEASLHAQPLPPMLLQPLVENAIQHGLEPKIEGGRVRITARESGSELQIVVEDDGVGFGVTTRGGGVGLSNLRERLSAWYGARARLAIEDARPGTRARLTLPLAAAATVASAASTVVPDPAPRPRETARCQPL